MVRRAVEDQYIGSGWRIGFFAATFACGVYQTLVLSSKMSAFCCCLGAADRWSRGNRAAGPLAAVSRASEWMEGGIFLGRAHETVAKLR